MGGSCEDVSDVQRRRNRAKFRFRAIVRLVIANLYWLTAEPHLKSKKLQIVQKRQGRYLLSIDEKSLLKTPPEHRTEEDCEKLFNVIGYLKCFRKYTEDVKRALVAHTLYEYYPPNRLLVRQNEPALAMYFVISGNLEILVTKFVPEIQEETIVARSYFTDGDGFGDSSLLHSTLRTASVKTITHCELLVLRKVDFDRILRALTLERTTEILKAVDVIPQFRNASEFLRRDLCIMSHIVRFSKNDIILGEGIGKHSHVHFLIQGNCKVIEHVPVKYVRTKTGLLKEALYTTTEEDDYNERLYERQLKLKSMSTMISRHKSLKHVKSSKSAKSAKSVRNAKSSKSANVKAVRSFHSDQSLDDLDFIEKTMSAKSEKIVVTEEKVDKFDMDANNKFILSVYPSDIRVHFMEICTLYPKSCFNVGEYFTRRRIVAADDVTCLRIPGYWLLPQSSIWQVLRDYLNKTLPDTDKIFRMYIQDKKFDQWTKGYVQSVLGNKKMKACNNIHNVPYAIRLKEDYKFANTF